MTPRAAAVNYGSKHMHYNDHLVPLCALMEMPLILIDAQDYDTCKRYYPLITVELADYNTFGPDYLTANYDVLFFSDLFDRISFHQRFGSYEEKYQKQMRHIHCPHGFSDKGFYLKKAAKEDILLVYGQNMLDLLQFCGVMEQLNHYVISGNYRYTYYKMLRNHFDTLAEEEVFAQFERQQPVILYAPTWLDYESSSTFFDCAEQFLGELPDSYNLLVKLHPRLELDDTSNFYRIISKYSDKKNIVFVSDFPVIYPLLERSDVYVGDMSSIGYDYLIYNRPMFFLNKAGRNPNTDHRLFLYRCGIAVTPMDFSSLFTIIDKYREGDRERFGQVREEIYHYTFGDEISFADLKQTITAAYTTCGRSNDSQEPPPQ